MPVHAPSDQLIPVVTGLLIVTALLLGALGIDLFWLGVSPVAKGDPAYGTPYLVKTCLIIFASWCFVSTVARPTSCRIDHGNRDAKLWRDWGTLSWTERNAGGAVRSIPVKRLLPWFAAFATLGFVLVARRAPGLVDRVAVEGGLVESLSVVVLLAASSVFAYVAARSTDPHGPEIGPIAVIPAGFALLAFVIAMEEVSWFQRVAGFPTPDVLAANEQGELNLHNLVTHEAENAYYFSGFLFFIVVPFLVEHGKVARNSLVTSFAPTPFLLYAAAVVPAYSFDMWNGVPTQLAFFGTLSILLHYGLASRRAGHGGALEFALIATLILTQAGFLSFGLRFERSSVLSEYKEFLLPSMLLLYSVELAIRQLREAEPDIAQPIDTTSS